VNYTEACKVLGISPDLDREEAGEEAKKKWKKLAAKLHPDVNKSPDAEEKFKKANEAYQLVSSDKQDGMDSFGGNYSSGLDPFSILRNMGNMGNQSPRMTQNISSSIRITFAESVLGCQKEIKINRQVKCENCNGNGKYAINNGCDACGGHGITTRQQGNVTFTQTCGKCGGRTSVEACKSCNTKGVVQSEATLQVNIPGGVVNGNILNLQGTGNYAGSFGPMDQYTDTRLTVHVTSEPGLSLEGSDVINTVELSLQEALAGCSKIVNTIKGYKDITIKPKSRHNEEVIIPHLGVNGKGNQRVILDVKYPEDVSKLIEALNEPKKEN
jgi:molecular chaperone DnaJ